MLNIQRGKQPLNLQRTVLAEDGEGKLYYFQESNLNLETITSEKGVPSTLSLQEGQCLGHRHPMSVKLCGQGRLLDDRGGTSDPESVLDEQP